MAETQIVFAPKGPAITVPPNDQGAQHVPLYGRRIVQIIPVTESELDSVSVLSGQVSLWSSFGTGFAFLVCSCIWSWATEAQLPPIAGPVAGLFTGLSIACYGVAYWNHQKKQGQLDKIMQEMEVPPATTLNQG